MQLIIEIFVGLSFFSLVTLFFARLFAHESRKRCWEKNIFYATCVIFAFALLYLFYTLVASAEGSTEITQAWRLAGASFILVGIGFPVFLKAREEMLEFVFEKDGATTCTLFTDSFIVQVSLNYADWGKEPILWIDATFLHPRLTHGKRKRSGIYLSGATVESLFGKTFFPDQTGKHKDTEGVSTGHTVTAHSCGMGYKVVLTKQ